MCACSPGARECGTLQSVSSRREDAGRNRRHPDGIGAIKLEAAPPLPLNLRSRRSAKRCIAAGRDRPLRSRAIVATVHCEATRLLRQIHLTQERFIAGIASQVLQQWIPGYPWHPAVVQLVGMV